MIARSHLEHERRARRLGLGERRARLRELAARLVERVVALAQLLARAVHLRRVPVRALLQRVALGLRARRLRRDERTAPFSSAVVLDRSQ